MIFLIFFHINFMAPGRGKSSCAASRLSKNDKKEFFHLKIQNSSSSLKPNNNLLLFVDILCDIGLFSLHAYLLVTKLFEGF